MRLVLVYYCRVNDSGVEFGVISLQFLSQWLYVHADVPINCLQLISTLSKLIYSMACICFNQITDSYLIKLQYFSVKFDAIDLHHLI